VDLFDEFDECCAGLVLFSTSQHPCVSTHAGLDLVSV